MVALAARLKLTLALAAALALAAPAAAQATLVFVRGQANPSVWMAATDGSGAHRIVSGSEPRISPDGQTIAYLDTGQGRSFRSDLMVVPASGGTPRRLAVGWREPNDFAWSPDASMVAAVLGPELGRKKLVLIDVVTGAQRTIAKGFFSGVSFAPQDGQLVYGRSTKEFSEQGDIYRYDIVTGESLVAPRPHALTNDHRSLAPLWGPKKIVFAKLMGAKTRRFGPKNELFLIGPGGGRAKRLTHTKVDPLLQGLFPTAWSASGNQLLTEFEGQDTSYAVAVNPKTGAQHSVGRAGEQGLVGTDISADGTAFLGYTGGFDPSLRHDVVSVPFKGGKATVLAKNAYLPDWNG